MSLLIENFENAFNSYVTTWKEEPVKMAAAHLTAATTLAAVIYYRKDIGQAAAKYTQNTKDFITSSKLFNNISTFANKVLAKSKDSSSAVIKNNVKDVTNVSPEAIEKLALAIEKLELKKLNNASESTTALVDSAFKNLNEIKDATASVLKKIFEEARTNSNNYLYF